MIYFIAFAVIVIVSAVIFIMSKSLKLAVGLPTVGYIAAIAWYVFTAKANQSVSSQAQLLFFLGTPMIFFASLLGPYLIENYIFKTYKNDE